MRAVLFAVIFMLMSCGTGELPGDVLPPPKMQRVFYDYLSADVYVNEVLDSAASKEEESVRLQKKIFDKYGITRKQFNESYNYYMDHPDKMQLILDSIMARKDETIREKIKRLPEKLIPITD